ncbi:hypothetical protein DMUE_5911 [Dictyocoela muelleri]|nr:hypothetical protein DMUE_5911 [Dictyocoela muelleri]
MKIILQYESEHNDEDFRIFGSDTAVRTFQRSKIWAADGTFYSTPKEFSQIYIIHRIFFIKSIPLIYILMKSQTEKSYTVAFNKIKSTIKTEPEYIITDFELSAFNDFKNVYTNSNLSGCYLYFTQIIVRLMNKEKILQKYKSDNSFKKYVKFIMILAYIPIEKVNDEFKKLKKIHE